MEESILPATQGTSSWRNSKFTKEDKHSGDPVPFPRQLVPVGEPLAFQPRQEPQPGAHYSAPR